MSEIKLPRCECGWPEHPVLVDGLISGRCRNPQCEKAVIPQLKNELESVPLEEASPELQKQFFELLAEQAATKERQKTHKCWFFVPGPEEYEKMKKYNQPPDYDKCPNCKKGRIVIEVYKWEMGAAWTAKCYWGKPDCKYEELITNGE